MIAAFVSTTASVVISWAIFYEMCHVANFKEKTPASAFGIVGITIAASMGCGIFMFRVISGLTIRGMTDITGLTPSFLPYLVTNLIAGVLGVLLYVLVCKVFIKPDLSSLRDAGDVFAQYRDQKLTSDQKISLIALSMIVIIVVLPSFFPKTWFITQLCAKFTVTHAIVLILVFLAGFQYKQRRLLDFATAARAGIPWDTVIMIAGSMPVAAIMKDTESGLPAMITNFLSGILGDISPWLIVVVIVILASLLTQVAHNLVLAIIFGPILGNLSIALGFNPLPAVTLLALVLGTGIGTPGGSVIGAMIFANSWISIKQGYQFSWLAIVTTTIAALVCIPLAFLLLG